MSTFEQLSKMPGVGVLYYFDVSVDRGATYTKAYSTQWWFGGSYQTEERIVRLGNLSRSLAVGRGFTATTIDVVLENTDGGVDWLCDRSTFNTQGAGSVWKLFVLLWDPASPTDYQTKVIGLFSLFDPPKRKADRVEFSLVDGGLGVLSQMAVPPSLRDWCEATDAGRPADLTVENASDSSILGWVDVDLDQPFPIVFGDRRVVPQRVFRNCYVACAVPGDAGVLPTSPFFFDGLPELLPRLGAGGSDLTIISCYRSATITKDGKDWHLIWFDVDLNNDAGASSGPGTGDPSAMQAWFKQAVGVSAIDLSNPKLYSTYAIHDAIGPISVTGGLGWSHPFDDLSNQFSSSIEAHRIAYDLLTEFLPVALTPENYTAATSARAGYMAQGVINNGITGAIENVDSGLRFTEFADGVLQSALRQVCSAGRFDIFFTWAGAPRFAVNAEDYASQTATLATLDETAMAECIERIPSIGERNAPTNRTMVLFNGKRFGPVDDPDAIQSWGGKIVAREVDGSWLPDAGGGRPGPSALLRMAYGQSVIRPVLSVVTGLNGLNFDLADYVKVTWTRGTIGGPYLDAIFRVEGIALAPLDGKVQLELVWCDDLRAPGSLPYILDDEDEALVVTASGGRTCTLTDGSITVEFSSGDLSADGVALGDVLVVRDAGESATAFKRNRTLIIVNIIDADTLEVDVTDFGSGGPFTISDWKIVHGPDNNPRPDYYGSTCTVLGQFYNLGEANRLLDG